VIFEIIAYKDQMENVQIIDKNNKFNFEDLIRHYHIILSGCDTSANVCFELHDCRYSIYRRWPGMSSQNGDVALIDIVLNVHMWS